MKRIIVFLMATCMAVASNARILRVSNVTGSSAPYMTIQNAHDAADEGDTIMVDGSNSVYDGASIKKRLTIIGPGFWKVRNGLVQENSPAAAVNQFVIFKEAAGTILQGLWMTNSVQTCIIIYADNCVVNRCYLWSDCNSGISFSKKEHEDPDPVGAVIHQNFFKNCNVSTRSLNNLMSNVQVTNNIFVHTNSTEYDITNLTNSYIAYNTMIGKPNSYAGTPFAYCWANTIEHNILRAQAVKYQNIHDVDNNVWTDNIVNGGLTINEGSQNIYDIYSTDKDIRDAELALTGGTNYGAFAGDSPYVISGIPRGPVIEQLIVPTTVEQGSMMQVTIKVGIQK